MLLILIASFLSSTIIPNSEPPTANATTVTLQIISPHPSVLRDEIRRAFIAYAAANLSQSVDINWIDVGGTTNDLNYIQTSFTSTPSGIGADLFFGGGVDPYISLANLGLLQTYQVSSNVLSNIPANINGVPIYDSQYRWYATALSGFGIIYNKVLFQQMRLPAPKTWADLANPQLKGLVASADLSSGSIHMCYELMLQGYGWNNGYKIIQLIGANVKSFVSSSTLVPSEVSSGDAACGLSIDYYAWAQVSTVGADKIGFVFPANLTTISPDSIAILKGAPNLSLAQQFISWVLSKPAQKLLMQRVGSNGGPTNGAIGRMSVIPSLYSEIPAADNIVPVNPFQTTGLLAYNATKGSLRYSIVNDLLNSTMTCNHDKLVDAWNEIIAVNKTFNDAGLSNIQINQAITTLTTVPISEKNALTASLSWSNQTLRNSYIIQWQTFSKQSYSNASNTALAALPQASNTLKITAQNNLYYGLSIGITIGLVLGILIMAFPRHRKIETK